MSLIVTEDEQKLVEMVPVGAIVKHYKGKIMKVLAIARHTEDHSLVVIYQKQYDCEKYGNQAIVVRPLKMFVEKVLYNGQELERFKVIKEHACSCC